MLRENIFRPTDVPAFERKLYFEGERRRPYIERFGVLLFLATVIATVGIISDSTATVIGAMIVAPLMLPIMATAAALVMGQMTRATQSALLVLAGVIGVIAVSWLLAWLYPEVISFTTNSQITARISPRLLDLVAALAAGAAGAFAMSRDDIADSLPGVAIAISLVPPLCVVGISLAYNQIDAALGALLLFTVNALAILLAGGGVLATLGLAQAATIRLAGNARRNAFTIILIGVLIITIPLTVTGRRVINQLQNQVMVRQAADEWLAGTDFEVRSVQIVGNNASLIISGPGEPPPFEALIAAVEEAVGQPLSVELESLASQKQVHLQARPAGP
ncbi:MAG: DUF389 domain-containing protein [Chloroflexota bacterium]